METLKNLLNISDGQDDKLQTLKRKARALHAKAEDVLSEIKQGELQPGKRRRKEVDNWLKDVEEAVLQLQNLELRGKGLITSERSNAGLIKQIGDLTMQGSFPRGFTFYDHGSSSVALVTTNMKINDRMLHNNKRKVISWLIDDGTISTVGVYGPGGVGKTVLLKEIHDELLERFKSSARVYWVSVSHGITLPMLQDKIAEAMNLSYLLTEKNAIRKAASLSYELKQRNNVFLFLDDVWEHFSLEEVGVPIGDENSCKLILTTRSLDVCRRMKCRKTVKVEPLSKEKAWELFSKVLGRRDHMPPEINELAELVAAECAGLPLGLIVMAGSMREVDDIQEWRNTLEELQNSSEGQLTIETEIFPVLKLSFDRLKDQRLKECFLLCALYPKYGEIVRDELIVLFRSEGLLDKIDSWQKQFDKGHSMLNKLENACLLERYDNRCVKMHNFIRDMAIRITNTKPRYMIAAGAELRRIPSGRRWTIDLDKASLMHNFLSEIQPGTIPMCPDLTTLLLQQNPFTKLPDSFFVHMKALKVLNLSKTSIKRLPDSISELKNLRALLLEFCKRLHFVPSVVKLTSLRELDFSFCWSMKDVPHGMNQLAELRFLDLEGCKDLCQLLSGSLSTFSHIQCLKLDPDVQSISGDDVLKLGCLERLEGCRISDVSNFNKYVKSQHFQQLKYYEFVVGAGQYKRVDHSISAERMVILCSGSLKGGSGGDLFVPPENTQDLQIHNSAFDARSLVGALPSLIRLTALKRILIRRCRMIEVIWSPVSGVEATQEKNHFNAAVVLLLQCLQELILTDLHDFRGLVKGGVAIQRGAFSNLKILVIKYCPNIKELFTSNLLKGGLDNLQELEVEGCEELEMIIAVHDDGGREKIIDFEGYVDKDGDLIWLPNLRALHLRQLPKLTGICHGGMLGKCSVEQISVEYCAKIKQIFKSSLTQYHLSNLREVKVAACNILEEIIASPNSQGQESSGTYELPYLRALELDDLPCLTSFFHGIIPTCGSIEHINVTNCPIVKRLPLSVPLHNNGEGLVPLFLQQIKADQEWWESLEWDNPLIKKTLLPFTKLSVAGASSFDIFEELGSPGRLHELENKFSKTKVNNSSETADINSCLTLLSDVLP
ncbi:LOW QUALITY PROTEIN: probable disease resistance protein At1g12280 [Chenopodium quinoa]|uniref:LOW QUALITY PROTEIN: probable disease resistance protein At1g12280 n=1 Tax=Chenopodium quinoa TaxID=63459 RepID=UPI000B776F02|nr:LOW QUALITY PROTEIN: probable disease resistance protein At1g12280 [Chenopodium quinoa]